ncbi:MAG TPA: NADH:ubiquinone oxidoreductase [Blastocatellia bacterium]|nr:NADH:ubiquinone oxidoreductase [Blastocatellia bacterium]
MKSTKTLLWASSGACSGETMAILGAEGYGQPGTALPSFLENNQLQLLWHPSLSPEPPREFLRIIDRVEKGQQPLTFFCVEGSIINGPNNTGMMDTLDGIPKRDLIRRLCHHAAVVFAMGTCAGFGGIPASPPNPSESSGLQFNLAQPGGLLGAEWRSLAGLPVINVSGCAVGAATMITTLQWVLNGRPLELDRFNRPLSVTPCLSDHFDKKCQTSRKVGYRCYGCTTPRFPVNATLFHQEEVVSAEKPINFADVRTFIDYF